MNHSSLVPVEVNTNATLFQVINALLTELLPKTYLREHHHHTVKKTVMSSLQSYYLHFSAHFQC
jgi:hypothetical protein